MTTVFEPAVLGPLTLRNRIVKAATFEGRSKGGVVTDELVEFHRRMAAGGVAMTTVAYLAVAPDGRTDDGCVVLGPSSVPGLRRLTDAVHEQGALATGPAYSAGKMFNPLGMRRTRAASASDIARITDDYRRGAQAAVEAGFDSLELHLGHNYLLSAFLSPLLNKRSDDYGGPLEHRARFAREVVQAVREAVGRDVAVTAKLNMSDGVRGGLRPDESLQVATWLQDDGALDAIELTGGSSLANPMYLFKGDAPLDEFRATLPWYLRGGFRLVGSKFLKQYPYEEAYFLSMAVEFRAALDLPLILLGGISRVDTAQRGLDAGFDFVAMGRALLHDPDLVRKWQEGSTVPSGCIHCNRCMPTIYTGTRCPLVDPRPGDRPVTPA